MLSKQPNISALTITNQSNTFKIIFKKSDQNIFIFIQELYIDKTITFDNSSLLLKKNNCANKQGLVGRGGEGSRGGVSVWQSRHLPYPSPVRFAVKNDPYFISLL